MSDSQTEATRVPHESYGKLFLRFLHFGLLAWGGPVAQIAMIRHDLVEKEKWVTREHFNRALAVYQVLPGPEAHELCVYFGMLARGRLGGVLAGLGFMLPGLVLMLGLSWLYLRYGLGSPRLLAVFGAVQAAVTALIVRAVVRIAQHTLADRWSWSVAGLAALAQGAGVHFAFTLVAAGLILLLARKGLRLPALGLAGACAVAVALFLALHGFAPMGAGGAEIGQGVAGERPSLLALLVSGLRGGLLTFGGAYTAIPFIQRDAVVTGAWMTNAQFLDGLALSGLIPAPLIIFSTFVGYLGGGWAGALVMTAGIFLPAFSFSLLGHDFFERVLHHPRFRHFLDGVTAGVVGLIAATTVGLLRAGLTRPATVAIFAIALGVLFRWNAKFLVPLVIAGAAVVGLLFQMA
ncbi:chromate efflux transporter [Archangium violaceum]|uniref:chromate efflux transporter n=1 Tax=Archangium violaceum TaxID=83451 RepID=UPI001950BA20|nr:chromate efflux transporter [Archangium violaceum]QRN94716.1 chromate efflux transporter [Archangium violaceum]